MAERVLANWPAGDLAQDQLGSDAERGGGASASTVDNKARQSSRDSRSGWRPSTGPAPSSAARSTREPSRELPPASAGTHSNLTNEGGLGATARGRHAGSDGPRSRSNSRRSSGVTATRGVVLTMFDEEIASLIPQHENSTARVEVLKQKVKEARREEQREAREQTMNKAARLQRRLKVTSRMQACVRGWLVRKRIVAALDHRTVQNLRHAAMLPDLLRDHLMQLQHGVHDLEFRPEDRVLAAVKLQAWWRSIAGRRVMKIIRLSRMLEAVTVKMHAAATVIQAWFKGVTTKLALRGIIKIRMLETKQAEHAIMETALRCIIQIQRGYRSKLARRAMERRRSLALGERLARESPLNTVDMVEESQKKELVDAWRPSMAPGAVAAGSGNAGVIIEQPPQHDWEIQKVEEVGLVPFYDASSEHQVRHQIGGPTALIMQTQLSLPNEPLALTDAPHVDESATCKDLASLQKQLGDPWGIYPNGFTHGFLPGLDKDVWEKGGRAKSYRNSLALRGVRKKKRRSSHDCGPRPCTTFALPPPSNVQERLQSRETRRRCSIGAEPEDAASDDPHPMLVNAPPQAALKAAPSCRAARYVRPYLSLKNEEEGSWANEEEGSWGFSTSISPPPTHRGERRPRAALEEEKEKQWNSLGVPFDTELKKKRPGEVDHERVWSIAHALAERLPALTAG